MIRILSDEVANRIAAGEVVERPASVVKELVENAVDSGAKRVAVRVWEAGKARIVVSDDGSGMSAEDAALCLKRHATSKITVAQDLDRITTLGFRGEALPSIASVSEMRITTRTADADEATELTIVNGEVADTYSTAAPVGTEMEVSNLFYNTPVRAKFLKTDATELKNIIETVGRIALVHPSVGFELKSETRSLLALPPDQPLLERAAELAGLPGDGRLYWKKSGDGERSISFAFTAPHENKGRRNGVRLFVNRRAVNDRILMGAVMEGYRGLIESGRYPVAMLWLELPPDEVDVNVHPAKREVRFRDEGRVFRAVAGAVSAALAEAPWAVGAAGEGEERSAAPWETGLRGYPGATGEGDNREQRVAAAVKQYGDKAPGTQTNPVGGFSGRSSTSGGGDFMSKLRGYGGSGAHAGPGTNPDGAAQPTSRPSSFGTLAVPDGTHDTVYGRLSHLGSFDATYLIFEELDNRELVLIDQHAAHERILYEKLMKASAPERVQQLLAPVVVDLSAAEETMLAERGAILAEIGLKVEPFGPRSASITQAPAGFSSAQLAEMVKDILSQEAPEAKSGVSDLREAAAARAACSAAVKARSTMTGSEVGELLERLGQLDNPTHCPHGRPLVLKLTRERLEGLFHRR